MCFIQAYMFIKVRFFDGGTQDAQIGTYRCVLREGWLLRWE